MFKAKLLVLGPCEVSYRVNMFLGRIYSSLKLLSSQL